MNEDQVRALVRRVVYRTLGRINDAAENKPSRPLITEADVKDARPGSTVHAPADALITPLARQVAFDQRISILQGAGGSQSAVDSKHTTEMLGAGKRSVAIGADHGGFDLKESLKRYLSELGYEPLDCGTTNTASVDYPDFAHAVARLVAQGTAWRGIVVDGAGIGSCMAANKVPGVRAAMCYDQATAVNSREHNHANVLTLGAGLIGPSLARQIVKAWLDTPSGGARHERRVRKIMEIERRYLGSAGDGE